MTVTEAGACGTPSVVIGSAGTKMRWCTDGPDYWSATKATWSRHWTPRCATRCCESGWASAPRARRAVDLGRHRPGHAGCAGLRTAQPPRSVTAKVGKAQHGWEASAGDEPDDSRCAIRAPGSSALDGARSGLDAASGRRAVPTAVDSCTRHRGSPRRGATARLPEAGLRLWA